MSDRKEKTAMKDEPRDTQQIEDAIVLALKDGDMKAVVSLVGLLAAVDPEHAEVILDALKLVASSEDDEPPRSTTPEEPE